MSWDLTLTLYILAVRDQRARGSPSETMLGMLVQLTREAVFAMGFGSVRVLILIEVREARSTNISFLTCSEDSFIELLWVVAWSSVPRRSSLWYRSRDVSITDVKRPCPVNLAAMGSTIARTKNTKPPVWPGRTPVLGLKSDIPLGL